MANKKRNTVVEGKIKNAEQTIRSYAYDRSLDTAIEYLKAHDPENSVLATIKDFENLMRNDKVCVRVLGRVAYTLNTHVVDMFSVEP